MELRCGSFVFSHTKRKKKFPVSPFQLPTMWQCPRASSITVAFPNNLALLSDYQILMLFSFLSWKQIHLCNIIIGWLFLTNLFFSGFDPRIWVKKAGSQSPLVFVMIRKIIEVKFLSMKLKEKKYMNIFIGWRVLIWLRNNSVFYAVSLLSVEFNQLWQCVNHDRFSWF